MRLTRKQMETVKRKWDQSHSGAKTYLEFRRRIEPYWDNTGCVMLPWCGMWVGIETDGYAHT